MKISSLNVDSWSTGRFIVTLDDGTFVHLNMTEDESNRIRQIAFEIFQSRQKSIANEIATASPTLLGDFREVKAAPVRADDYDDRPF